MRRTQLLLKNYAFHNFLKDQTLPLFVFFLGKNFSTQKMFMSCFCLRPVAYLNSKSNALTYLLIVFFGSDWFRLFLNK